MNFCPNFFHLVSHIPIEEQKRVAWPGSDLVFKVNRGGDPQKDKRKKSKGRKF